MTMINQVGSLDQISASLLIPSKSQASASKSSEESATASANVAAGGDVISLSKRALQQLTADEQRLGQAATSSNPDVSSDQKQQFSNKLAAYEIAQARVTATAFNPQYQTYVDTINDPLSSDDQKLQAYMGFKANRAVEHGQAHTFGVDDVDFKFDWLTRNSDFMIRARSSDQSLTKFNQTETAENKRAHTSTNLNQHLVGTLNVIAQYGPLQKAVASVDLIYDKVSSALASWDLDKYLSASSDERSHPDTFAVDPKNAIAGAVASALEAMQRSRAGSSPDPASVAFRKQFSELVTNFGRLAANREDTVSVSA